MKHSLLVGTIMKKTDDKLIVFREPEALARFEKECNEKDGGVQHPRKVKEKERIKIVPASRRKRTRFESSSCRPEREASASPSCGKSRDSP